MKARYTTRDGRVQFEVEGGTAKDVFRELALIQEVFDAESSCGLCHGTAIRLLARKVEDYDFYELACENPHCRARFAFGQAKKNGALFPKRKDEDGNWLPNGGWAKWEPQGSSQPMPAASRNEAPEKKHAFPTDNSTPDGLQPSFDRLGELFNKTAPTRLSVALDMIRDQFGLAAGQPGTQRFDKIYRAYEASTSKGTTAAVKALLKDCVAALDELSVGARPFGGQ